MENLIERLNKAESKSQVVYLLWADLKNSEAYQDNARLVEYLTAVCQNGGHIDFGYTFHRLLKYAYTARFNNLYFQLVKAGYRPVFIQTAIADCCEVSHALVKAWIVESTQVNASYVSRLEDFNITDYEFIDGKAQKIKNKDD